MSRFPEVSRAGAAVPASIFIRLREHLARFPGDVIPLQIGDTHLAPPARLDAIAWAELAAVDVYAYNNANGWGPLVDALVEKARVRNRIPVGPAGVQVAVGATHALACAVQAVCDPGDELILLTPHWPLIRGIALGYNVVPVEVPFTLHGAERSPDDAVARIEAAITPRTTALYFATPNNPDGAMYTPEVLAAIAAVCAKHGLWILSDEVYEDYTFDGAHASIAAVPGAAERTITVFSFSKSYAQAGLRVGYAFGPDAAIATIKKLVNHSVYNVPVAMQRAALAALTSGAPFLASAKATYAAARDRARARLRAPSATPPGAAYLWVDFRAWTGDDCMPILERCAAAGVLLAPGHAFGAMCGGWARLCYTGVPAERLEQGIDRINAALEGL
ncbi:MAG TPA: pyridoxal phosphate-dependent aminotransferase [Kofleriaceae bacterium]|nr:pyridoxal phosphate-dependent aminotransferase [Kofleriaceae bacterium]